MGRFFKFKGECFSGRIKLKNICNSRPRRFGKSITADMMTAYYSRSLDTEEMFEKLNIGQAANQKIQDEYQTADS